MPLNGKAVYITGASGGLGEPLVVLLEKAGATVICHDRKEHGDLAGDLDGACENLAKLAPDILVNLAGVNDFGWCEGQDAEKILRINLLAPIRLTQAVLPVMKKRGHGQIVNVGSMTGLVPLPYYTSYVASKAGLKGFSDSLRRELWGSGIAVTHFAPRAVKTAMNGGAIAAFNEKTHIYLDTPEKIAERIFRAIVKKQKDVRVGVPERFYAFMSFLFPGVIDRGLEGHLAAGREVLSKASDLNKTISEEIKNEDELAA